MWSFDPYAIAAEFAATSNRSTASSYVNLQLLADVASADRDAAAGVGQDASQPRTSSKRCRQAFVYDTVATGCHEPEETTESDEHATFVVADKYTGESMDPAQERCKRLRPATFSSSGGLPCAPAGCQRTRSSISSWGGKRGRSSGAAAAGALKVPPLDGFANFATKYRDVLQHADPEEAEAVYSMVALTQGGPGAGGGSSATQRPRRAATSRHFLMREAETDPEEDLLAATLLTLDRGGSPGAADSSREGAAHHAGGHPDAVAGSPEAAHSSHGGRRQRRRRAPRGGTASDDSSKSAPVPRHRRRVTAAAAAAAGDASGDAGAGAGGVSGLVPTPGPACFPGGMAAAAGGGFVFGPGGGLMAHPMMALGVALPQGAMVGGMPQLLRPMMHGGMLLAHPMVLPTGAAPLPTLPAGAVAPAGVSASQPAQVSTPAAPAGGAGLAALPVPMPALPAPFTFPGAAMMSLPPGLAPPPGMLPFLAPPWGFPPGCMPPFMGMGLPMAPLAAPVTAGAGAVSTPAAPGTAAAAAAGGVGGGLVPSSGFMMGLPPPLMMAGAPFMQLGGHGPVMGVGVPVTVSAPGTGLVASSGTATQQQEPVQGVPCLPRVSAAVAASAAGLVKQEPGLVLGSSGLVGLGPYAAPQLQLGVARGCPAQGVPVLLAPPSIKPPPAPSTPAQQLAAEVAADGGTPAAAAPAAEAQPGTAAVAGGAAAGGSKVEAAGGLEGGAAAGAAANSQGLCSGSSAAPAAVACATSSGGVTTGCAAAPVPLPSVVIGVCQTLLPRAPPLVTCSGVAGLQLAAGALASRPGLGQPLLTPANGA